MNSAESTQEHESCRGGGLAELRAGGADFVINSCADISVTESAGSLGLHLKSVNV
jgi:hypothetical protein